MAEIYDEMNARTQREIQLCFLALMRTKNFTKITVRDITEAAAINRGTFYLHYQDKFDLLEQMQAQLLLGLKTQLGRLDPPLLLVEAEKGNVSIQAIQAFEFIEANSEQFHAFLGSNNPLGFHRQLKQFFMDHFLEKMDDNPGFFQGADVPADYLAAFATSAYLGLIEQWLENGLQESPREMAEMYLRIIGFIRDL